ncbi:hypothetical protein ACFXPJ_32425, partial [Streptomyces goshikiensis]
MMPIALPGPSGSRPSRRTSVVVRLFGFLVVAPFFFAASGLRPGPDGRGRRRSAGSSCDHRPGRARGEFAQLLQPGREQV